MCRMAQLIGVRLVLGPFRFRCTNSHSRLGRVACGASGVDIFVGAIVKYRGVRQN